MIHKSHRQIDILFEMQFNESEKRCDFLKPQTQDRFAQGYLVSELHSSERQKKIVRSGDLE